MIKCLSPKIPFRRRRTTTPSPNSRIAIITAQKQSISGALEQIGGLTFASAFASGST